MANWNDPQDSRTNFSAFQSAGAVGTGRTAVYDQGLRRHMLSIYNYMASAVLLSGIVALVFANTSLIDMLYAVGNTARGPVLQPTILGWIVMLAPLGIVMAISFGGAQRFSVTTLQALFWSYAVLFGASISYILLLYTGGSVAATFFAAAGAFAGTSLFGYTTKKDISGWGSFLIMGVVGLLVSMLLNAFLFRSPAMDYAISFLGVLIFAGLTAYYTQSFKQAYAMVRGTAWEDKQVVLAALTLYIAFINMFLFLLRFMGVARN